MSASPPARSGGPPPLLAAAPLLAATLTAVVLLTVAAPAASAGPGKDHDKRGKGKAKTIVITRDRDAWCFDRGLAFGTIVITGGRCYTFYIVHAAGGAYLGFGPPGPPMIPPGQLVRLNTPAGKKHKGRLFYLVPMPSDILAIPVESIRMVTVRPVVRSSTVVLTVPSRQGVTKEDREFELPFTQR